MRFDSIGSFASDSDPSAVAIDHVEEKYSRAVWADFLPILVAILLLLAVAVLLRVLGRSVSFSTSAGCASDRSAERTGGAGGNGLLLCFIYACGMVVAASEAIIIPTAISFAQLVPVGSRGFGSGVVIACVAVGALIGTQCVSLLNDLCRVRLQVLVGLALLLNLAGNILRVLLATLVAHGHAHSSALCVSANMIQGSGAGLGYTCLELWLTRISSGDEQLLERYVRGYYICWCLGDVLGSLLPTVAPALPAVRHMAPLAQTPAVVVGLLAALLAGQLMLGGGWTEAAPRPDKAVAEVVQPTPEDRSVGCAKQLFLCILTENFINEFTHSLVECATSYVLGVGPFNWQPRVVSLFMAVAYAGILPSGGLHELVGASAWPVRSRLRQFLGLQAVAVLFFCPWAQDLVGLRKAWICYSLLISDTMMFSLLTLRHAITESMALGNVAYGKASYRAMWLIRVQNLSCIIAPPVTRTVLDVFGQNTLGGVHFLLLSSSAAMIEFGIIPYLNVQRDERGKACQKSADVVANGEARSKSQPDGVGRETAEGG